MYGLISMPAKNVYGYPLKCQEPDAVRMSCRVADRPGFARLHVEANVHDVAVGDNVLLALRLD
jgi:hypothetical protein